MAQTGFTPVLIYGSTTAAAVPTAGNLSTNTNGIELAANATDGKLFYKDNAGVVQVLATKAAAAGTFSNVTITGGSINGTTVGATTASTGAFTTLSASSTVSGTGFSTYLASPPAIGGTAAAAGSFTTLSASSTVTLSGGTANGVAYLNGSKVVTTGTALAFDGTNFKVGVGGAGQIQIGTASSASFQTALYSSNGVDTDFQVRFKTGVSDIGLSTATALSFSIASSEQMRLTSTGLGIGTSSVDGKLVVYGTAGSNPYSHFKDASGADFFIQSVGNSDCRTGTASNHPWLFFTNGSEKMRLDSAGNLGLGVTPSAWFANRKAIQINNAGSSIAGFSGGGLAEIRNNSYLNASGSEIYTSTNAAAIYQMSNGVHAWYTAPSGTAGNAITFTQAMTLDASGNLLVGQTSTGYQNSNSAVIQLAGGAQLVANHVSGTGSGAAYASFGYAGGNVGSISQAGTTGVLYNITSDYRLKDIAGPVTNSGAFIDKLNPVQGSWKADGSRFIGFLAHELQEASETVVGTGVKDGEEMQSIDYSNAELIANLVAEIQSLRKRLATAGI